MSRLWLVLLPELRRFPTVEQAAALKAARDTPLDVLELIGMAAGLVAVTALTRYSVADAADMAARFGAGALNFVVALPLLAAVVGPFHIRRLRRALREQLLRRGRP